MNEMETAMPKSFDSLGDTINEMMSPDYRVRFVAEYHQTKIRYEKLKKFCDRIEAAKITGRIEPKHDCPIGLLREQRDVMEHYLHILEIRAEIEEIEL
jgi:hypothetical protein